MGNDGGRAGFPIHWLSLNGAMSALMMIGGIGMLQGIPLLALLALPLFGALAVGALGGLALFLYRR